MPLKEDTLFEAVDLLDEAVLFGLGPITLLLIIYYNETKNIVILFKINQYT